MRIPFVILLFFIALAVAHFDNDDEEDMDFYNDEDRDLPISKNKFGGFEENYVDVEDDVDDREKRAAFADDVFANEHSNPINNFFSSAQFDLVRSYLPKPRPVSKLNLSKECADDVQFYRNAINKLIEDTKALTNCDRGDTDCQKHHSDTRTKSFWVLQQLDSFGKIPPGLMLLNRYWHGSYKQCLDINVVKPDKTSRYQGKYCHAMLSAKPAMPNAPGCPYYKDDFDQYDAFVRWGVCIPNSCTGAEAMTLFEQYEFTKGIVCNVFCVEREQTYSWAGAMVILLLSLIAGIVVIATIYDYNSPHPINDAKIDERPAFLRVLLCFSFYTNGKRIFDTTPVSDEVDVVHGIRVLSMFWVMICRSYLEIQYIDNLMDAYDQKFVLGVNLLNNGTFSVDNFFTLSGFLVAYIWLRKADKRGADFVKSKRNWFLYYVHRYIRLTPVFALIWIIHATLFPNLVHGPHQHELVSSGGDCAQNWWTYFLYVNNVIYPTNHCFSPAWYLANNMQFFAIAPLMLVFFFFRPVVGALLSMGLIFGSMASIAALTFTRRFPAMLMGEFPMDPEAPPSNNYIADYQRLIYFAPWSRFPAYGVGLVFAFAWHRYLCKVKMNKIVAVLGWCVAFIIALSVIFGLANYVRGHQLPIGVRMLYAAFCRPTWAAFLCWIIFACLSGRGGPINDILSWRGWLPLSKISYCMYLLHAIVIQMVTASNWLPNHFDNHWNWMGKFASALLFTTIFSFVATATLEIPIMRIEQMIFNSENKPSKIAKASSAPEPLLNDEKAHST